jgi:ABC-2 type transport system permease protein
MNAILALMRNDLRLYFSSRRALLMNILAPILIAAFFGSIFESDAAKAPLRIPIAVVDLDHGDITQRVVAAMKSDTAFDIRETPEAAAQEMVKKGEVRASVVIPAGFGEQLLGAVFNPDRKPVIAVHYDPSQSMTLAVVNGLLVQHVLEGLAQSALRGGAGGTLLASARDRLAASTMDEERRRRLLAIVDAADRARAAPAPPPAAAAAPPAAATAQPLRLQLPFTTRDEAVTSGADRKYNSYAHSFAGMGVQFILFMGIDLGVGLLLARRLGLWKRLRAAPLSRAALIGARMGSGALIALILLMIIYAAAMAFFGVRIEGSTAGFAGVAVAFAVLTATFGLLIAALGKTPEATRGLAVFVTLLLVMLSGAWVPSFIFPEWLQTASLFVPSRWAVDGLDGMTWRGLGFGAALAPIGVMLGFSAAFAALALWRFDWEE